MNSRPPIADCLAKINEHYADHAYPIDPVWELVPDSEVESKYPNHSETSHTFRMVNRDEIISLLTGKDVSPNCVEDWVSYGYWPVGSFNIVCYAS